MAAKLTTGATQLGRQVALPVAPAEAAANLLAVIERLTPTDSGGFFAWDGTPVPW